MTRLFYRLLLRLHPRRFREPFGEEMLWVFDEWTGSRRRLVADAAISLVRQWFFRPAFPTPASSAATPAAIRDGVPVFYLGGGSAPRAGALMNGAVFTVAAFLLLCFAIGRGHVRRTWWPAAASDDGLFTLRSSPGARAQNPLPIPSASRPIVNVEPEEGGGILDALLSKVRPLSRAAPPEPNLEMKLEPAEFYGEGISGEQNGVAESNGRTRKRTLLTWGASGGSGTEGVAAEELVRAQHAEYSQVMPVAGVLDRDHDQAISGMEIDTAAESLRMLDMNRDGTLGPEEWGFRGPRREDAVKIVRFQPVLAALDADRDARVSPVEIRNAAEALRRLDKNGDGKLTTDEILPDPAANLAAVLLRLDVNGDGRISAVERSTPHGERFRGLFDRADRNQDGWVSEAELSTEIRRCTDLDRDGAVTWAEFLKARQHGALGR